MDFLQIDVFADGPFRGNQLAVFPEAGDQLSTAQMQAIASEMNLSETSFVTSVSDDSYEVRIFTPSEELPFAGHPTIGTCWVLRRLGKVGGDRVVQHSPAGETPVELDGDRLWFTRTGDVHADLETTDPKATDLLPEALGLEPDDIGLDARELDRPGRLRPAFANAGFDQLMVPLRNVDTLTRCRPRNDLLQEVAGSGTYCFTPAGAGQLRSRGFFPGVGVAEDPATGVAAAAMGLYLADRIGGISLEVIQGVELGRPSRIFVKSEPGTVQVGGRSHLIFEGKLQAIPEATD
jgi:trans-2,3-dihydro-3-hydroxyanthranilate isomerase